MISRLQQLCVQSSRTPVSLPKVFSDPIDPWRILQQRAKNTIYSDYRFKMRGTRLKTQCSTCLHAFVSVCASKFTGKIRCDVERQEASNRGILAVNVWFLWCCGKIIQQHNIDMLLPEPCPVKMSGCRAEIKDWSVGGSLDFHLLNTSCRQVPAVVIVSVLLSQHRMQSVQGAHTQTSPCPFLPTLILAQQSGVFLCLSPLE